MTQKTHSTTQTNVGILLLRFLGAHSLSMLLGIAASILTQPLWTWLLYRISGREATAAISWTWYLFTLAPFYVVLSTLTLLVTYVMMTGASEKAKSWQRVLRITLWIHLFILLSVNLILGGRMIP
jgi:hypothetical protein